MSYIESSKSYTGNQLETVFFKPMLSGESAQELGIRILYNMPVPTTVQLWSGASDILKAHTTTGWSSPNKSTKTQKEIDLKRVKAEMGFAASDYYSLVFESMAAKAEVNLDDLTGTELEAAETELFRQSIAESLRATMWVGDTSRDEGDGFHTFDGFIKMINTAIANKDISPLTYNELNIINANYMFSLFRNLLNAADERVRDAKASGNLVIFVTSDLYALYEQALDDAGVDASYVETINGRTALMYHGIQVVDLAIGSYLSALEMDESFAILTDRRNLAMAVNTSDFPGTEIRMWYNPDEMENRQRATFAAGCTILDESLITMAKFQTIQEDTDE